MQIVPGAHLTKTQGSDLAAESDEGDECLLLSGQVWSLSSYQLWHLISFV